MNYDRLEKTADLLDKVPEQAFEMDVWRACSVEFPFDGTFECGFAGCAVGWVIHTGLFPEFTFNVNGVPRYQEGHEVRENWPAVQKLYGLSSAQAGSIFSGDEYDVSADHVSPRMVADRIRHVVRQERMKRILEE